MYMHAVLGTAKIIAVSQMYIWVTMQSMIDITESQ